MNVKRIIITSGEPSGIGPDLIIEISKIDWPHELVVCINEELLVTRAKLLGQDISIRHYNKDIPAIPQKAGVVTIIPFELEKIVIPGVLNAVNSKYVLSMLEFSSLKVLEHEFDAIITAPVHKGIINESGISFSGHTEFFAERANCEVVMMLANEHLHVALVTTHIPLSCVASGITPIKLKKIIKILNRELISKFKKTSPKIYVCGLNPHAGEDGHLGREELDIIIPTLNELRDDGINIIGPLPADTIFTENYINDSDVILTMYHDQGLPVLKSTGFGKSINITLGLPYIRVSVDHGTALSLAGTGLADPGSMICALNKTFELINE